MEPRKQPPRRCKDKSAPEYVHFDNENVAGFSPRPFLKTEPISVELLHPPIKTEPVESDNEEYSQVNPKCMKCELEVDCKKEPDLPTLKTEPVDPENFGGFPDNFEQTEFPVSCSSKSSSSSQNGEFIIFDFDMI